MEKKLFSLIFSLIISIITLFSPLFASITLRIHEQVSDKREILEVDVEDTDTFGQIYEKMVKKAFEKSPEYAQRFKQATQKEGAQFSYLYKQESYSTGQDQTRTSEIHSSNTFQSLKDSLQKGKEQMGAGIDLYFANHTLFYFENVTWPAITQLMADGQQKDESPEDYYARKFSADCGSNDYTSYCSVKEKIAQLLSHPYFPSHIQKRIKKYQQTLDTHEKEICAAFGKESDDVRSQVLNKLCADHLPNEDSRKESLEAIAKSTLEKREYVHSAHVIPYFEYLKSIFGTLPDDYETFFAQVKKHLEYQEIKVTFSLSEADIKLSQISPWDKSVDFIAHPSFTPAVMLEAVKSKYLAVDWSKYGIVLYDQCAGKYRQIEPNAPLGSLADMNLVVVDIEFASKAGVEKLQHKHEQRTIPTCATTRIVDEQAQYTVNDTIVHPSDTLSSILEQVKAEKPDLNLTNPAVALRIGEQDSYEYRFCLDMNGPIGKLDECIGIEFIEREYATPNGIKALNRAISMQSVNVANGVGVSHDNLDGDLPTTPLLIHHEDTFEEFYTKLQAKHPNVNFSGGEFVVINKEWGKSTATYTFPQRDAHVGNLREYGTSIQFLPKRFASSDGIKEFEQLEERAKTQRTYRVDHYFGKEDDDLGKNIDSTGIRVYPEDSNATFLEKMKAQCSSYDPNKHRLVIVTNPTSAPSYSFPQPDDTVWAIPAGAQVWLVDELYATDEGMALLNKKIERARRLTTIDVSIGVGEQATDPDIGLSAIQIIFDEKDDIWDNILKRILRQRPDLKADEIGIVYIADKQTSYSRASGHRFPEGTEKVGKLSSWSQIVIRPLKYASEEGLKDLKKEFGLKKIVTAQVGQRKSVQCVFKRTDTFEHVLSHIIAQANKEHNLQLDQANYAIAYSDSGTSFVQNTDTIENVMCSYLDNESLELIEKRYAHEEAYKVHQLRKMLAEDIPHDLIPKTTFDRSQDKPLFCSVLKRIENAGLINHIHSINPENLSPEIAAEYIQLMNQLRTIFETYKNNIQQDSGRTKAGEDIFGQKVQEWDDTQSKHIDIAYLDDLRKQFEGYKGRTDYIEDMKINVLSMVRWLNFIKHLADLPQQAQDLFNDANTYLDTHNVGQDIRAFLPKEIEPKKQTDSKEEPKTDPKPANDSNNSTQIDPEAPKDTCDTTPVNDPSPQNDQSSVDPETSNNSHDEPTTDPAADTNGSTVDPEKQNGSSSNIDPSPHTDESKVDPETSSSNNNTNGSKTDPEIPQDPNNGSKHDLKIPPDTKLPDTQALDHDQIPEPAKSYWDSLSTTQKCALVGGGTVIIGGVTYAVMVHNKTGQMILASLGVYSRKLTEAQRDNLIKDLVYVFAHKAKFQPKIYDRMLEELLTGISDIERTKLMNDAQGVLNQANGAQMVIADGTASSTPIEDAVL